MEEERKMSQARELRRMQVFRKSSEATLREMKEFRKLSEARLREMEEDRRLSEARELKKMEVYRNLSEARLRKTEELRKFLGARPLREMEEFRKLSEARLRQMEEDRRLSQARQLRNMEEHRKLSEARLRVMEVYRKLSEARLRKMEEQRELSEARQLREMKENRNLSEARLREMEEFVFRSFKDSPRAMESWGSISEEKWKMKASDVKEGKGDKKTFDEEGKQYGGNGSKDDGGGAEADKTEMQGQEHYEQGSCDDDSSEQTSGTLEEDLSREILELQLKDREEPDKVAIFEGTVTSEGFQLDLNVGAIHLTFPPGTVAEPTGIIVYRWKNGACLPQLEEHEAIVSNVIEISAAGEVGVLKFNGEVKLVLSHSAAGLEGYQLVMKGLTDTEKNEWEEIARCEDIRQVSDIEDDYPCPKNISYFFPVVRAGITKCSTYAVISRLKLSPTYTITVSGGTFAHPDYPLVTITVPQNAVGNETRLPLQLKVQEVPQDVFQGRDIFAGPILRVLCSSRATFLEPLTIQLPVSLGGSVLNIPHDTVCRVRVFYLSSEKETREWVEISNELENPASFDGRVVKFKVRGFSRFTFLLDWTIHRFSAVASGIVRYLSSIVWNQPLVANFFAYFKPTQRLHFRDILFLICCPAHLRKEVEQEREREKITPCEASSQIKMIPERDKAFVFVSGGISPSCSQDLENIYLCLHNDTLSKAHLEVRLISSEEYCKVEFRNETETLLSTLKWKLSSPCIDNQEALDTVDERLVAVSSVREGEENSAVLPRDDVQLLESGSCDSEEIVLQWMQNLNLDKTCLEQPTPETTRMMRCFSAKAKILKRSDVVKHLRDIAPAGTTGPLLPGDLDVQNIPCEQIRELSINLSGGEEWKVVAERLGFTAPEIRYLDHRTRNPFEAALTHYIERNPMKVDDLYDILTECGMPVLADIL
ncbi:uncharacterized protein [Acropora muricata]